MIEGVFVERPDDVHVRLRSELFERGPGHLRAVPATVAVPAAGDDAVAAVTSYLDDELRAGGGLVVLELGEPLPDQAFVEVASSLGDPRPQPADAARRYGPAELILELVGEHGRTSSAAEHVSSTNYLSLHTEGSTRPPACTPRFIALMCCDPGDETAEAETVLVPMASVREQLDAITLEVLAATRYRTNPPGASIARWDGERCAFSFKDFVGEPLAWAHTGQAEDADHVNRCIRALLCAMLAPGGATCVRWKRGDLAVWDNTRFFHGRTAGGPERPTRPRHMKHMQMAAYATSSSVPLATS